jgi:hypothetical protein
MRNRRKMQAGDWFSSAVNVVMGVLLGSAAHGAMQLVTTVFFPVVVLTALMFGGLVLLDSAIDRAFSRFFGPGIRPAHKPGRKPLARTLSLPTGFVFGVFMAAFGVSQPIIGTFL